MGPLKVGQTLADGTPRHPLAYFIRNVQKYKISAIGKPNLSSRLETWLLEKLKRLSPAFSKRYATSLPHASDCGLQTSYASANLVASRV